MPQDVRVSLSSGTEYLPEGPKTLKAGSNVISKANFWRHHRSNGKIQVSLKIGRYHTVNEAFEEAGGLESQTPKSELTLNDEELAALVDYVNTHYFALKEGQRRYHTLTGRDVDSFRDFMENQDTIEFIKENNISVQHLTLALEILEKKRSVEEFKELINNNETSEAKMQVWLTKNNWVLGSEFVEILDDRTIDIDNISDYLTKSYDGFIDIIEIKKPNNLSFWAAHRDHNNLYPHSDLVKAITQATNYIQAVEKESNSLEFFQRVGRVIKPRAVLVYGRSISWGDEEWMAFRLLNSSYHSLTIMTYDQVLERANNIIKLAETT